LFLFKATNYIDRALSVVLKQHDSQ